jgi:hypothetical protein
MVVCGHLPILPFLQRFVEFLVFIQFKKQFTLAPACGLCARPNADTGFCDRFLTITQGNKE